MTVRTLDSCLLMLPASSEKIIPSTIFYTENAINLDDQFSLGLYHPPKKPELATAKYKIGKSETPVEFFEATKKGELASFLKLCDSLILDSLQASVPPQDSESWKNGALDERADGAVRRIELLLEVRRMFRNCVVLNALGGKRRQYFLLHYTKVNANSE